MDTESGRLTVFYEGPFWVGVFERVSGGRLSVCRVVFGAEPKDGEVLEFILRHYHELKFSPAVEAGVKQDAKNPKRRQREAGKLLREAWTGTKSQQALQLQREEAKALHERLGRERREAERQRRFMQSREKRKEKHKGH